MEIKRSGSQPSKKGPSDWFTGTVRIDSPFKDPERLSPATVNVEPRGIRERFSTQKL